MEVVGAGGDGGKMGKVIYMFLSCRAALERARRQTISEPVRQRDRPGRRHAAASSWN